MCIICQGLERNAHLKIIKGCFSIFLLCNSVLFGILWSLLVLFSPLRSHSVHSVHFGPIQSTLVLVGPFCLLWIIQFNLVQFSPILSILSTSVLFSSIRSYSVYLSFNRSTLVLGPNRTTSVHLVQCVPFVTDFYSSVSQAYK